MNLSFRYLALEVFAVGRRIILDSVRSAGTAVDFVAGFLVVDAAFPLNILLSKR